jgi:hypothetical protein
MNAPCPKCKSVFVRYENRRPLSLVPRLDVQEAFCLMCYRARPELNNVIVVVREHRLDTNHAQSLCAEETPVELLMKSFEANRK